MNNMVLTICLQSHMEEAKWHKDKHVKHKKNHNKQYEPLKHLWFLKNNLVQSLTRSYDYVKHIL